MKKVILLMFLFAVSCQMRAEIFDDYNLKPEVKQLISVLEKNSKRCLTGRNKRYCKQGIKDPHKGTGWCYRYVKLGLLKSGMTSKYLDGGSAIDAGLYLEAEGFINILKHYNYSPRDSPIGSVFVYKSLKSVHGHIEVKVAENRYISDYVRAGGGAMITGIYVKSDLIKDDCKTFKGGSNAYSLGCLGSISFNRYMDSDREIKRQRNCMLEHGGNSDCFYSGVYNTQLYISF